MWRRKHIILKHVGFIQIKGNNATLKGFYSGVYPRTSFLPPHNLKDLKLQSGKKLQLNLKFQNVFQLIKDGRFFSSSQSNLFIYLFFFFALLVKQSKEADGAASPALNQYHHKTPKQKELLHLASFTLV